MGLRQEIDSMKDTHKVEVILK